jgi:dihydroorotate dehydrogenase electron transfer subunit
MKIKIGRQTFIKEKHLLLELVVPRMFERSKPGQFVHIRIEDSADPLLRRPLSIHDIVANGRSGHTTCKVLYEIVGKGTALLAEKKAFDELDVLGPLGNGFDMKKISKAPEIYLVAGGMGVVPLYYLAKQLVARSPGHQVTSKIIVLIGGRTKEHVLCEKDFKALGCDVHVATDDGSKGFKGRVTELLKNILPSTIDHRQSTICACGPKPMLAVLAGMGQKMGVPVVVSLEEFMGCGLGACLGCVIHTTSGYKRICHDGPVFNAEDIIWKE